MIYLNNKLILRLLITDKMQVVIKSTMMNNNDTIS